MFKLLKKWILRLLTTLAVLMSITVLLMVVYEFGFPHDDISLVRLLLGYRTLLVLMWVVITLRIVIEGFDSSGSWRSRGVIVVYSLFTLIILAVLAVHYKILVRDNFLDLLNSRFSVMAMAVLIAFIEISRDVTALMGKHTNPAVVIAVGFASVILVGAFLLGLPNCTVSGISFTDSLFISTSAVCVTGLTTVDVSSTLTTTGFVVLLMLIQVGGLGIMTLTSFFGVFFTGQSFAGQMAVRDLVSSDRMTGLVRFLLRIIIVTLTVEAIGALFIYLAMISNTDMAHGEALFFAVFHAVSAFCNAGFSTLSGNLYDPAVREISSVIWVVSWLIIFGGIGFPIFANALSIIGHKLKNLVRRLMRRRPHIQPHMWSLNSFIVVRTTFFLLVVGWGAFLTLEWNNALAQYDFWDKLSQGFLMAVTPRTAGFNGVDLSAMLPASIFLTIVLMWIGGAPQSTAGGIKVTTFYLAMHNIFSGNMNERIEANAREIPSSSVRRALAVIMASLTIISIAVMLMSLFEPTVTLDRIIFEVFSAIGTVGLTLNLSPELSEPSKYIDIVLMFIGRVGVVSLLVMLIRPKVRQKEYSYPTENILIS